MWELRTRPLAEMLVMLLSWRVRLLRPGLKVVQVIMTFPTVDDGGKWVKGKEIAV